MREEYGKVRSVIVYVMILNFTVAAAKLFFGFLANSLSMMADGFHSLFDSVSNIIGLVAINIASKPPDKDHPYGHRKYENMATIGVAFLIFFAAFEILTSAVERLLDASKITVDLQPVTFAVMVVTLVVNIIVSSYEKRKGVEFKSAFLVADSQHTRTDVFASLAVLLGFIAVELGYHVFDPFIALFISFMIARMGYGIIKESSAVLCDASPMEEKKIREQAMKIPGVLSCHRIRARGKDEVYVDLHVLVDSGLSVEEAHEISTLVEKKIREELSQVKEVIVHIEPKK